MSDIQLAIIKILNHVGFDYNPYTDSYYYNRKIDFNNVKLDYLQNAFVIHDCHCIITFSLDNREHTISADINGIHIVTKTTIPEYLTTRQIGGKYRVDEDYEKLDKFNEYISENIDSVRLYLNGDFLISSDAIRDYSNLNLYMEKAKLICIESHVETEDYFGYTRDFFCKKLIVEKPDPDLYDDKKVKFVATEVHSVKILEKPEKYHSFYNHNGPIGWDNRWRQNEE